MKGTIIFFVLLLLAGVGYAQQDTTTLKQKEHDLDWPPQPPDPTPSSGAQPTVPQVNENKSVDPLIRIRPEAVPSSLRNTLQQHQYRGWEQSPVYHSEKRNEYWIDIRKGDSIQTFRFDRTGSPIKSHEPR